MICMPQTLPRRCHAARMQPYPHMSNIPLCVNMNAGSNACDTKLHLGALWEAGSLPAHAALYRRPCTSCSRGHWVGHIYLQFTQLVPDQAPTWRAACWAAGRPSGSCARSPSGHAPPTTCSTWASQGLHHPFPCRVSRCIPVCLSWGAHPFAPLLIQPLAAMSCKLPLLLCAYPHSIRGTAYLSIQW